MANVMPMLAALALCAGAVSCAGGQAAHETGDGDWGLAGTIAAVEPGPAATRVTVDAAPGAAEPRVVLLVSPATELEVRRADGTIGRGSPADLAVGARLQARHTGAEMRSLPPQYQATHVRVLSGS